jgi:hypothetical protein
MPDPSAGDLEREFFGFHAAPEIQDAVEPPQARALPRHRARRHPHWKPALEPVEAQHAYDRDTLVH